MTNQKIFVSYARADSVLVLDLSTKLRNEGVNLWLDQLDIPAGTIWDIEIEKALQECDCLLFIISAASSVSTNVLNEVYYALEQNKRVIPVKVNACELPFRVRRLQHIDMAVNYDYGYGVLLKTLKPAAGPIINLVTPEKAEPDNKVIVETVFNDNPVLNDEPPIPVLKETVDKKTTRNKAETIENDAPVLNDETPMTVFEETVAEKNTRNKAETIENDAPVLNDEAPMPVFDETVDEKTNRYKWIGGGIVVLVFFAVIIYFVNHTSNPKDASNVSDTTAAKTDSQKAISDSPANKKEEAPKVDMKKFTPPKIVKDEEIKEGSDTISGLSDYDKPFTKVEIEAHYGNKEEDWVNFLAKKLRYPEEAKSKNIQGTVIVQFIVNRTGNTSAVEAISGPEELKAEAVRCIKVSGKWKPASQNGREVNSYKKQEISFKLSSY